MKDIYCCTGGLGHINKCPLSFTCHIPFPLKQSCRDVILCQLYLQLNCQSMLPCGQRRQWNLQAPFSFIVFLWVNRAFVFALCSCFFMPFFRDNIQDCLFLRRGKQIQKWSISSTRLIFPVMNYGNIH